MHIHAVIAFLMSPALSLPRASSPSRVVIVGSSPAMGGQEAGGQLLPQTLPLLDTRYSETNNHTWWFHPNYPHELNCWLSVFTIIHSHVGNRETQRASGVYEILEVRSGARSVISQIRWLELHNIERANMMGRRGRDKDRCRATVKGFLFSVKQRMNEWLCNIYSR